MANGMGFERVRNFARRFTGTEQQKWLVRPVHPGQPIRPGDCVIVNRAELISRLEHPGISFRIEMLMLKLENGISRKWNKTMLGLGTFMNYISRKADNLFDYLSLKGVGLVPAKAAVREERTSPPFPKGSPFHALRDDYRPGDVIWIERDPLIQEMKRRGAYTDWVPLDDPKAKISELTRKHLEKHEK